MAIVATNNPGKLVELKDLLKGGVELLTLEQVGHVGDLDEDQDTIEGNAVQKAKFIYEKYGQPCLADDSGLEVNALQGAPGVYSARYAGPGRNSNDNISLLLANLQAMIDRSARFRTVIAYCDDAGVRCFEGILNGTILHEGRGTGGFGYDPVFLPHGSQRTLAEMSLEEKNLISHRSIAVRKLAIFLNQRS
jgi:XTP/dITP diphosphohydrolase